MVIVSVRAGRGPSVAVSILAVAAFDFFCVPPYLTFAVSDTEYLLTFSVMLIVALTMREKPLIGRSHAPAARSASEPSDTDLVSMGH